MRAAVALSGGVDSSFSAYLLSRKGYEVIGITLKIPFVSGDYIERARYVCQKLSIPHYTLDIRRRFDAVQLKRPLPCSITVMDKGRVHCILKGSQDIPRPGQLAVFYDRDKVAAGGWIEKE